MPEWLDKLKEIVSSAESESATTETQTPTETPVAETYTLEQAREMLAQEQAQQAPVTKSLDEWRRELNPAPVTRDNSDVTPSPTTLYESQAPIQEVPKPTAGPPVGLTSEQSPGRVDIRKLEVSGTYSRDDIVEAWRNGDLKHQLYAAQGMDRVRN